VDPYLEPVYLLQHIGTKQEITVDVLVHGVSGEPDRLLRQVTHRARQLASGDPSRVAPRSWTHVGYFDCLCTAAVGRPLGELEHPVSVLCVQLPRERAPAFAGPGPSGVLPPLLYVFCGRFEHTRGQRSHQLRTAHGAVVPRYDPL
jgi:hypothetical protein